MRTSLLIIDDFLENADALRRRALALTYPRQQGMFPGRNSVERIPIEGMDQEISRRLCEPVAAMPPPQAHAKCRLTMASDKGQAKVHVDAAHWSGILYLSRDEDCRGGTEFFRHRATRTDHAPYTDSAAQAKGFPSAKEMTRIVLEDGLDDSKWELTMRVPMRFNRLVLFRPWLWHTAGENFGDTPENARLVYLMFFGSLQR